MATGDPIPVLPMDGSSAVKMKGLPFRATCEDVIRFFTGFMIRSDNVFLKRHSDGRPNGEAFVVMESPDEARKATQKDRETFGDRFGDRYVRVYPTLDSDLGDMEAAVLQKSQAIKLGYSGAPTPHSVDSVIKIKSLPFDATQLDIFLFFQGFKLKPNGVQLVVRSDNRPTGEAFVDFESPEEAGRAIAERDHKVFSDKFGDRYVRLIQVSRHEMQATLALRFGGEGILKMKGLPFKANSSDVRKFFTGYRVKPDGVSFIMHGDGRPTGMAFVEFDTPQEALRAMDKDRAKFAANYGDRFCMLQLVGRHEMGKVVLQRENESSAQKILAALVHSQALQQPMVLGSANPWMQLSAACGGGPAYGGFGGAGGGFVSTSGVLSAPPLAAAAQYGAQHQMGMHSFLQPPSHQQHGGSQITSAPSGGLDSGASWASSSRDRLTGSTTMSANGAQQQLQQLMSPSSFVYYQQQQDAPVHQPVADWARMSADGGGSLTGGTHLWMAAPAEPSGGSQFATVAPLRGGGRKSVSYSGGGSAAYLRNPAGHSMMHPVMAYGDAEDYPGGGAVAQPVMAATGLAKGTVGAILAASEVGPGAVGPSVSRLPSTGVYWEMSGGSGQ